MAKEKQEKIEREYIIPLRREIMKVPKYKRAPKAVKAVKKFIAKHMKIPERDDSKVKIDKYLNQELWFRGIKNPPAKIKVKVKKEGEIFRVELAEIPEKIKFAIAKQEKLKKQAEKTKKEKKHEEKEEKEEKTEEEKKEEVEKTKAAEEAEKEFTHTKAKEQKHTQHILTEKQQKTQPKRMVLQK